MKEFSATIVFLTFFLLVQPPELFAKSEKPTNSQSPSPDPHRLDIVKKWFWPVTVKTIAPDTYKIVLSGFSHPSSTIILDEEIVKVQNDENFKKVPSKDTVITAMPLSPREDGYFEFELHLKSGSYHVPITVEKDKNVRKYQLSFRISKESGEIEANGEFYKNPFRDDPFTFWVASGLNYLEYSQSLPKISEKAKFKSLRGPSFFLKGNYRLTPTWEVSGSAKISPGGLTSSENVQVNQGNYKWLTFTGETIYYLNPRPQFESDFDLEYSLRAGLQQHSVPFLSRSTSSEYRIKKRQLTMGTIGLQVRTNKRQRLYYESFLRYQTPILTARGFSVSRSFSFDGSIGAIYRWNRDWRLGLFWYGQSHQYLFDDETSGNSGEQELFFSNLELRLGWNI